MPVIIPDPVRHAVKIMSSDMFSHMAMNHHLHEQFGDIGRFNDKGFTEHVKIVFGYALAGRLSRLTSKNPDDSPDGFQFFSKVIRLHPRSLLKFSDFRHVSRKHSSITGHTGCRMAGRVPLPAQSPERYGKNVDPIIIEMTEYIRTANESDSSIPVLTISDHRYVPVTVGTVVSTGTGPEQQYGQGAVGLVKHPSGCGSKI